MATAGGVLSTLGAQTAHADIRCNKSMPGAQAALAVTAMMRQVLIVAVALFTGLRHVFVRALARSAAPPPLAAVGGILSMLGTQAAQCGRGGLPVLAPRYAFVHAPARDADPMASAGGTLSMRGAQAAHAYKRARATRSYVRRLAVPLSWPSPEACSPCWARRRLMPT